MGGETQSCCFLLGRRSAMVRGLPQALRSLALLGMAGLALLTVATTAFSESGYLKPAVSAKALKKTEGYYRDGVELYRRRKYRAALRKFVAADRVCPELFSAGYHIALVHRKMGKEDAAIAQLKKLNTRFPENIIARNDLGVIYASKNKEESDLLALLEFRTAIRNGENLLLGEEKKVPQVRVDLAMAYANLGALQVKSSKLSDAEKSFRKAAGYHPLGFFGHFGLGNVLFAMKRFSEAKTAYRKAEEIEPGNDSVHVALAKCYLFAADKNPRFAIGALRKVRGANRPPEVFDLLGDAYALLGNTEQAMANYLRYEVSRGRSPQVLYKLGMLCYNGGDLEHAKDHFEKFAAEASDDDESLSTVYKLLGDISLEEKEYEKAVANYLKGTKLRDFYFSCYYGLAESYFHLKQYEKAKEYVLLVLKGVPRNGSVRESKLREKASSLLEKIPSQD